MTFQILETLLMRRELSEVALKYRIDHKIQGAGRAVLL